MAQSVKRPTSAQVMISRFVGSSPASGSVLATQSLEPASDSVSPSLSAPPLPVLSLSLSLSQKNKEINIKNIFKNNRLVEQFIFPKVLFCEIIPRAVMSWQQELTFQP